MRPPVPRPSAVWLVVPSIRKEGGPSHGPSGVRCRWLIASVATGRTRCVFEDRRVVRYRTLDAAVLIGELQSVFMTVTPRGGGLDTSTPRLIECFARPCQRGPR